MREPRLLVLVPHEPDLDPRIAWVLDLCRQVGRTDVIAATWNSQKPLVEYDGVVSIERIDYARYSSRTARAVAKAASRLDSMGPTRRFWARQGTIPAGGGARALADHHLGALLRFVSAWGFYGLLISALHQRGRAVSIRPTAILSHDIYALMPAVLLKRRFGAQLVHDSHEYFPESDLLAPGWQKRLTRLIERPFIKRADRVITVSPQLARVFEQTYSIDRVESVPNAEPRSATATTPPERSRPPVLFLIQGQASPGRGFEQLFTLWSRLDDPRVRLQVRCPDGAYPQELRTRFTELFESGRAEWLDPVGEGELVSAAAEADVGVIPYVGPSLNHLFACPNKLSQYMSAGLAVLACSDLVFVRDVVTAHDCGTTYDAADLDTLRRAVDLLAGDPQTLARWKANARRAALDVYNWEAQSQPYLDALRSVFG